MDITHYVAYFEDMATNHKSILHTPENPKFARMNIEEILAGRRSGIDFTGYVLILESYEGQFADNGSDNIMNGQAGAMMVVKHVAPGDFDAEVTVLNDSLNILFSLLSKIKKDSDTFPQNDTNRYNGLVKKIDFNSVSYHKVGPVMDNCFGYRMQFKFNESLDLSFKPADWLY
jgi:hypothetical protein